MDGSYWRDTFAESLRISSAWAAEQTRTETVLAALLEFHSRLVLLGPMARLMGVCCGREGGKMDCSLHSPAVHPPLAAYRVRPEPFGALLRADVDGDGALAVGALRARHERGRDNLHRALRGSMDKFCTLQLELAQLHGAPPNPTAVHRAALVTAFGHPQCRTGVGSLQQAFAHADPERVSGALWQGGGGSCGCRARQEGRTGAVPARAHSHRLDPPGG
eukprot:scaffold12362_cov124-Isochrysis_galbana.AAC.2